jgi:hypothetical protein
VNLKIAARQLRETAGSDTDIAELCDAAETLAKGYVRESGRREPKQASLHRLWKREPPERL